MMVALIRNAERDVAAIAIYQQQHDVQVYYSKNVFLDGDEEHATRLADLFRYTACDPSMF